METKQIKLVYITSLSQKESIRWLNKFRTFDREGIFWETIWLNRELYRGHPQIYDNWIQSVV